MVEIDLTNDDSGTARVPGPDRIPAVDLSVVTEVCNTDDAGDPNGFVVEWALVDPPRCRP